MGQKHEKFREFRTPFSPRDIRKNPRSMYARVLQVMAQFVLKIELLSHIMGTTPILEMARADGLRPRLWFLIWFNSFLDNDDVDDDDVDDDVDDDDDDDDDDQEAKI